MTNNAVGLNKSGAGTLTVNSGNAYFGGTVLNRGTIAPNNPVPAPTAERQLALRNITVSGEGIINGEKPKSDDLSEDLFTPKVIIGSGNSVTTSLSARLPLPQLRSRSTASATGEPFESASRGGVWSLGGGMVDLNGASGAANRPGTVGGAVIGGNQAAASSARGATISLGDGAVAFNFSAAKDGSEAAGAKELPALLAATDAEVKSLGLKRESEVRELSELRNLEVPRGEARAGQEGQQRQGNAGRCSPARPLLPRRVAREGSRGGHCRRNFVNTARVAGARCCQAGSPTVSKPMPQEAKPVVADLEARRGEAEGGTKNSRYAMAKAELEKVQKIRDTLDLKVTQETVDKGLPKSQVVVITDFAESGPAQKPRS